MADTDETAQTMNTYYISGGPTDYAPILTPLTLDHNSFPFVVTAPDSSFVHPKYIWEKQQWVENDATNQGTLLADLQKQLKDTQSALAVSTIQMAQGTADDADTKKQVSSLATAAALLTQQVAQLQQAESENTTPATNGK